MSTSDALGCIKSVECNLSAHGYAMVALLVAMSIMAVMLGVALPVWQTVIRREREAELVFRGEQYVQAIRLFQRRYAGTLPPSVDVLVEQKFLRRRYQDPVTRSDFRLLYAEAGAKTAVEGAKEPGQAATSPARGGIIGVVSTSSNTSLRLYNGRARYNEWAFIATDVSTRITPPRPPPGRAPPLPPR